MVGHQHTLQAIQNQQPGAVLKLVEQPLAELGSLYLPEAFERLAGDIGEGAPAEVGHDSAPLVEGIPETASPVRADLRGMFGGPLPGQHALARAANGVEQDNRVRVGSHGPVAQDVELRLAAYEPVGADVGRFRVEGRRRGDGVGRGARGNGSCVKVTAETGDGVDSLFLEFLQSVESGVDAMHRRTWLHLLGPLAKHFQLLFLAGVGFNIRFAHQVIVPHDKKQDRPVQPLGFVELNFRKGELGRIAVWVLWRLPVLTADDPNVGRRVPDHPEGGLDDIDIG